MIASDADWDSEALYLWDIQVRRYVFILLLIAVVDLDKEYLINGYRSQLPVREYEGIHGVFRKITLADPIILQEGWEYDIFQLSGSVEIIIGMRSAYSPDAPIPFIIDEVKQQSNRDELEIYVTLSLLCVAKVDQLLNK